MATRKLFGPLSPALWGLCLAGLAAIATLYRTLQWNQLPPGLATAEAKSGIIAQAVAAGHQSIGFHLSTGFSPLWELLQVLSISVFGSTITALRIVALVLSLAVVATTYGWARSWYDRRTAWVAAFLMAVVPWSLTLSRNALPTILAPLVMTSLLWAMTGVMRNPTSNGRIVCLLATIILALAAGPWGWLSLLIVGLAVLFQRKLVRRIFATLKERKVVGIITIFVTIIAIGLTGSLFSKSFDVLITAFGIAHGGNILSSALRTLSMFFYYGDPDFHHNLGGEPMLNAFLALAFATGILLSLSRFQRSRDRILLIIVFLGLIPAMISGGLVPNAARASLALPAVLVVSAVGIYYLLDLWSATFPVNSAARSLGLTAIGLLLVLTAFQGYTQYFTAWANSSETYTAYNRTITAAALFSNSKPDSSATILIGTTEEKPVSDFIMANHKASFITTEQLKTLPTGQPRYLIITASAHDNTVSTLAQRFPGGTLKAHLDRDGSELFYDYIIKK